MVENAHELSPALRLKVFSEALAHASNFALADLQERLDDLEEWVGVDAAVPEPRKVYWSRLKKQGEFN